jgi:hypothetical protein
MYRTFYEYLSEQFVDPSSEFTRFLLQQKKMKHIRATALDSYRAIAKAAFKDVFTAHVLRHLEITSTVPKAGTMADTAPAATAPEVNQPSTNGVVTTEAELAAFDEIRRRLAFLAGGEQTLYDAISKIQYRDYQGKMAVFYRQERKGRLADLLTGKDDRVRFVIADGIDTTVYEDLSSAGERLKALFVKRIGELG